MTNGTGRQKGPGPWKSTKETHDVERLFYFLIMIKWLEWLHKMYIFFEMAVLLCFPPCMYFCLLSVFSPGTPPPPPHVNHMP